MRNNGSELTSEMVGPAGSTSDGAFSGGFPLEEDDPCRELLLED
jgi:hypothetical protein